MYASGKMKRVVLLFIMTCVISTLGDVGNNITMVEVAAEVPSSGEDSEQELSSQLQEVDIRGGWSSWADWSPCSRSCDGGVSHQLRTCRTGSCQGEHIRYKICNMQCVAVLVAVVAAAHASGIGIGLATGGVDSAAVLTGPSGVVARTGLGVQVAGPALGLGLNGIGLGGLGLGLGGLRVGGLGVAGLGLAVPAGSGLEGQWIPDINEKLHDDGSYKPQVYGW